MNHQPQPPLAPTGPASGPQMKEVRLHLPVAAHINLHSLKLLRRQSIRDSVVAALDAYFRAHPIPDARVHTFRHDSE